MTAPLSLKLRVEGMDCGGCALKVETAMQRLPGVGDVAVDLGGRSLSLTLDEALTPRAAILARIEALGYQPFLAGGGEEAAHQGDRRRSPWWAGAKGRLAVATGLLLVTAYIVSLLAPAWAGWAYGLAVLVGLVPIARRAIAGALAGAPFSIETLMSIAAVGALAIGEAGEAAMVLFLFAVGEVLEGVAAGRARAGIEALARLIPRTARRIEGEAVRTVAVEDLKVGDRVVVRPGDRVPSDGIVESGRSELNEAPVTGESVPVLKEPGARVFAGSINANGELRVAISSTAADNTIARIVHMVEEAQAAKAPTARLIDRFSRYYTPAAMLVAALVIITPPLLLGADWQTWIYRGLAVLLIACPCALVISTPAAVASGLASGARLGLLIKGGAALEMLGKVRSVAFDKTGTLTAGQPRLTDLVVFHGEEGAMLAKAAAVEQGTSHPLGAAIVAEAQARGLALPPAIEAVAALPGRAVTGLLASGRIAIGSPRHAAEAGLLPGDSEAAIAALQSEGKTVVVVSEEGRALGLIALRDEPREDAASGIARLRALGIAPVMLTGDNARTAATIGERLGIEVEAGLLPDDKLAAIARLERRGPVAMVGDGINDAPALAAASVGIAMGGGTDVALETADAALLKNRVGGVAELVALSRATLANIRQNIGLALGLKGLLLATTLVGATPLWMAILADTGATVLVTANALRLLRWRG